jgi:Tfp pilus assembly protein PilX
MMDGHLTSRRLNSRTAPRGVALVAAIVTMTIGLALFAIWAQSIVREKRQLANQQFRLQAVRLAEAGLRRAAARRTADPEYENETWSVLAEELGGRYGGAVRIRVSAEADATATHFEAIAEYPVGAVRRAQITKQIEIPNPPGEEP